jgi:urease accessory protein
MDNPGAFDKRDPPLDETKRNWDERAFTVGIGGPVGRCASALQ